MSPEGSFLTGVDRVGGGLDRAPAIKVDRIDIVVTSNRRGFRRNLVHSEGFVRQGPTGQKKKLTPDARGLPFHVHRNDSDTDGTVITTFDKESFTNAGWDPTRATKVVIHGFTNTIYSPVIQMTKNGRLSLLLCY